MKALVDIVEDLTSWLEENVCPQISLLEPDDDEQGDGYSKGRVHPKAYPLFQPWANESPEYIIPGAPGIVVGVLEGKDELEKGVRRLQIQLQLISYHPGTYGTDIYYPDIDKKAPMGIKHVRKLDEQTYRRCQDGWKDSYNFLDICLREIHQTEFIKGMRICTKDQDLTYGHYRDDTGPVDLYPYWINYIRFTVETGYAAPSKKYSQYL